MAVGDQAAGAQLARLLEDRVGDRGDVRVDALEVADDVEVQRARFHRFDAAGAQAVEVVLRRDRKSVV